MEELADFNEMLFLFYFFYIELVGKRIVKSETKVDRMKVVLN